MGKKLVLLALILASTLSILWNLTAEIEMEARFEVAGIAHNDRIPFKVKLKNTGNRQLAEYLVVATAGDNVQHFDGPALAPGESGTVEGELTLLPGTGSLEFSARIIGPRCSYLSEEVKVARHQGVGGDPETDPNPNLYSQQLLVPQSKQQLVVPSMGELDISPGGAEEVAFGNLEPVEASEDVNHLISRVENNHCDQSLRTLQLYQKMGNSRADSFLLSSL